MQFFRQQNRNLQTILAERATAQINDQTFQAYPSAGELYYALYENKCKDGGNQQDKMVEVTTEFNGVIKSIFKEYELVSDWDHSKGSPAIMLMKRGKTPVPIEALSLGEQEILSLTLNLYASKDSYDVCLIDEPEVHLNWHLEEELFEYLHRSCIEFDKQMIVVTHSRVIFKNGFLKLTQFLYWDDDGKIKWGDELTEDQRRRIAGEAIEIIKLGDFTKPTFFLEDDMHTKVVSAIARVLGVSVSTSECGNSTNVRSLYRLSKADGGWKTAVFMTDGDNQGNPFRGEDSFVHLDRYCMENYLLDFGIAAVILARSENEVRQLLFESIREKRDKVLDKNKHFDFLFDRMKPEDLSSELLARFDGSVVFDAYLKKTGLTEAAYIQRYVEECQNQAKLTEVFPKHLVERIQGTHATADSSHN